MWKLIVKLISIPLHNTGKLVHNKQPTTAPQHSHSDRHLREYLNKQVICQPNSSIGYRPSSLSSITNMVN